MANRPQPRTKTPVRSTATKASLETDYEQAEIGDEEYHYYNPVGRTAWIIDASSLKGSGLQKLRDLIKRGEDAELGDASALLVPPSSHQPAQADVRIRIPMIDFRKIASDTGRLAKYLQEPIAIEEDGKVALLVLPTVSGRWKRYTEPLRALPAPLPATQFILPPILPELHVLLAKQVGEEIGLRITAAIEDLTRTFRGFTRETALAASAGQMSDE